MHLNLEADGHHDHPEGHDVQLNTKYRDEAEDLKIRHLFL